MTDKEVIVKPELGYTVTVNKLEYVFEFCVYKIEGFRHVNNKPVYVTAQGYCSEDVFDSKPIIIGHVHCQRTSEWKIPQFTLCLKGDPPEQTLNPFEKIIQFCYDYTRQNLDTWKEGVETDNIPITSSQECPSCVTRGKTWEGSDPKCAFTTGVFSSNNWNCATLNKLRELTYLCANHVQHTRVDEQNYCTLPLTEVPYFQTINSNETAVCLYFSWYKSRGLTEVLYIMFDTASPREPTLKEVEAIIDYYKEKRGQ